LTGIGIVVAVVGVVVIPQIHQRVVETNSDDMSIVYRKNMAIMAVDIIKDHPISGIGPGQVPFAREYYVRMDSLNLPLDTGYLVKKHLHNIYLQIGAEFGMPGLILLIAILINMLWISARAVSLSGGGEYPGIAIGIFWAVVTIIIGENFDCLLRAPGVAMMIFWLVGMSAGTLKTNEKF
jgi:O-antigen ligase